MDKKLKVLVFWMALTAVVVSVKPESALAEEDSDVFRTYALALDWHPMSDPSPTNEDLRETYYAKYIIPIVVAADEEFQAVSYWTPFKNLNWKEAAVNMIERADNEIYAKYGINFKIIDWKTWNSDDSLRTDTARNHELADELNWNPKIHGNTILLGFTGQPIFDEEGIQLYGCAFRQSKNNTKCALINPMIYWADDNIVLHEISHLLGITYECYNNNCVMSWKKTYISILNSDGWSFLICDYVPYSYLSLQWCSSCSWTIFHGKYSIIQEFTNWRFDWRSNGIGKGVRCESCFSL